jgi:L-Lysine epsilon oxidase N-terminal/L-lysine epsilon oxidase C-terminal domain
MAIQTIKIHPAIGIARIGNSPDFFVGPELPGDRTPPGGGYKDAQCRLKRQAARFRLFAYDQNGTLVKELTAADGQITWTAHLANTKSEGDRFHPVGTGSSGRRNASVNDRSTLKIDPGARSITGPNQSAAFDTGKFLHLDVPLGEMRTDQDGRLLILGGFGNSNSPQATPLTFWAENDGWHDDVSDGPVTAAVTLNGTNTPIQAVGAWVICPPPKFAPAIDNIITLYDTLYQVAVDKGQIVPPATPSFNRDIFPILDRAVKMRWVNAGAASAHSSFVNISPLVGMDAVRQAIVGRHRDPTLPPRQASPSSDMPKIFSDIYQSGVNDALTKTQYGNMQKWAAGTFVNDWTGGPPPPDTQITPDGLDRAALENCVGGAFYPGIETSWLTRDAYPFVEPFRPDVSQLNPGDLTRQMAVPWQTDFTDCAEESSFLWWPAQRPDQVWPEDGTPQASWTRDLISTAAQQAWQDMVQNWWRLGIVVQKGSQYLETERSVACKSCAFIIQRATLGEDEINARGGLPTRTTPAVVPKAFRVVVDGFRASDLQVTGPTSVLNVPSPTSGLTFDCTGNTSDTGNYGPEIQRFTFDYNADFGLTNDAFGFGGLNEFLTLNVTAASVSAAAQIELVKQPNPFILHGDPAWLSIDLRVFVVRAGETRFGVPMGPDASGAPAFIQSVMKALTNGHGSAGGQTFDNDLKTDEATSSLYVNPTDGPMGMGNKVFNFALAKVRYIGTLGAKDVRVFFRLFQAQSTSTAFDPATYPRAPSNPDLQPIPLAGYENGEYHTVPFFAADRIDSTAKNMDQQTDPANVQTFIGMGATEEDRFYGCWLDFNQPFTVNGAPNNRLPVQPPATNVNGPFTDPNNPPVPIQQVLLRNHHQCLVAEIAFDPIPIPAGKDPSNWDKLAQRNLAWSDLSNPGVDGSRLALSTFEIRATPSGLIPDATPDELMIDWGNTPSGSLATIYLPAVKAGDVLAMAAWMYATRRLERVDDHTLRCRTGGITYVPIPPGTGTNYAGLLSVELPAALHRGQAFNIVVRQVTNVSAKAPPPPPRIATRRRAAAAVAPADLKWRRVLGAFQLTIPVKTKDVLLEPEERLLSVMRWIGEAIPLANRWYPVFQRYLDQIAIRVTGFGGDPTQILPSPSGEGRRKHRRHEPYEEREEHEGEKRKASTGKIVGLIFDRFGDFEGFLLDTEDGEHKFLSREKEIEALAQRAWRDRLRITVSAERDEPHRPSSIIVREPTAPFSP